MLLTSVRKRYGHRRWVLTEIHLDVAAGQLIAITGANGSGKSTLLNIMAGITRPTTGTVTGRPRSIGYVPERFPVRTRLSAPAYLRHMGRIRGLSTPAAARRASGLMDRFGLSEGDTPLRELSKGNAQRVGLIQALLVRPDLLILDEPATGLDELGHDLLTEIVVEVAQAGGVVVLGCPLHSESPVGAVVYELRGGRLATGRAPARADPAREPMVRIVLRPGPDARDLPAPWETLLPARPMCVERSTTVPNAIIDGLLSAALSHGWSVVSVIPLRVDVAGEGRAAGGPGGDPAGEIGPM
jgi:ABC-type Mn2+/Zn2+ transport system ATPase subunit